jgi:hypothetical protein
MGADTPFLHRFTSVQTLEASLMVQLTDSHRAAAAALVGLGLVQQFHGQNEP